MGTCNVQGEGGIGEGGLLRGGTGDVERGDGGCGRWKVEGGSGKGMQLVGSTNTAEGMFSRGGNRSSRYHSALGSAQEVLACLQVAEAFGYVAKSEAAPAQDRLRRIIGTLIKLVG